MLMAKSLTTSMVMHPVVCEELLRDDHMQRLDRAVNLISRTPQRELAALGDALSSVEVLITSWGCSRIDADALARMPRLKLIAHLAGSVKGFLDDLTNGFAGIQR